MDSMVIIGGGVAGLTAAENARKNNGSIEIIMISEEKYFPYSRIKLSKYMYNEFDSEELYLKKEEWYKEMNIKVLLDKKVMEINPEKNWILLDNHEEINYTTLVIASGSSSFVPPISGVEKRGVFTVRNMEDVLRIQSYIRKNNVQNICVVGGGLLGIEAAWSLREVNDTLKISIIETMPRLLPRQLDDEGSSLLEEAVKRNGINLYKGVSVKEIWGEDSAQKIVLTGGVEVPAQLIIISAGIRSNIALPSNSGIKVNRGVIVDINMKTDIDNIYAAGDIAEFNGNVWGLWPVSVEQGKIAGLNASGTSQEYKEITPSSLLQVMDIKVYSTGDFSSEGLQGIKYNNGVYSKLFFRDGVICGGILIGDTKKSLSIKRAVEEGRNFEKELKENVNILHII